MRYTPILALPALALLSACSGPTRLELERAVAIQSRIDAVDTLHSQLAWPKHFEQIPVRKHGDEFDVMGTLTNFPHLRMDAGYVLDYVYEFGGIGGEPVVYARKADDPPATEVSGIIAVAPERQQLEEAGRAWQQFRGEVQNTGADSDKWPTAWEKLQKRLGEIPDHDVSRLYLKHVMTDGSDDGFIELAALSLECDQFYLFWHAGYKERTVILTKEKADKVVSGLGKSKGPPMPGRAEPPRLTPALLCPKIVRAPDSITVSFHVFSAWGGLSRHTFRISPTFPHRICESEPVVIVPYECGIVF